MSEYIDKQAVLHEMKMDIKPPFAVVMDFPPADVQPVVHGEWIWNPNGMDWGLGSWECSECACRNNNLPTNNKKNPLIFSGSNFCPNCGADMRGGKP